MMLRPIARLSSLALLGLTACGGAAMPAPADPGHADVAAGEAPMAFAQAGPVDAAPAPSPGHAAVEEERTLAAPTDDAAPRAVPAEAKVAEEGAGARPSRPLVQPRGEVKAGEWDDNANFREFNQYLSSRAHLGFAPADVSVRRFIVVRDADGKGVPNCRIRVADAHQHQAQLTTTSSGRAILFPRAEGLRGGRLEVEARCGHRRVQRSAALQGADGAIDLQLTSKRALPARRTVDLAFILDTTGSMGEEIKAVKDTIRHVAGSLGGLDVDIRVGLVEYKDNHDRFVTRTHAMSSDLVAFARSVDGLRASGGGDTPENANRGLSVALEELDWREGSIARLAFLVGDAPPHLDYPQETSYVDSMRRASEDGIQVYTIAASGMDQLGQAVWRQIAHYTGGTNMFVLRGGAGPQSTGGGDPESSCGGTQTNFRSGNLAGLIERKVRIAVGALDRDPMRIAGLHRDENAKPCHERLVIAQ